MQLQGEFQIAGWKVQPKRNRMESDGAELRLEPKVMQVLVELATHAGQVLSKEELIQSIWPGVSVSEASLTRCISELRHVFKDDPRAPHVIETINKQGYRLMLPVQFESGTETGDAEAEQKAEPAVPASGETAALESDSGAGEQRPDARGARRWGVWGAILLVLIAAAAWGVRSWRKPENKEFRIVPFTAYQGNARAPSFSPDGNQIAFVWNGGGKDESPHLYVKLIGSEPPLRITSEAGEKYSPAWSPDGRWIAFVFESGKGNGIYLAAATGGEVRQIYRLHGAIDSDVPGLSWSPDGKKIIFSDNKTQESSSAIYSLSLDSYEAQQLTHPENSWDGDLSPAYSPDGRRIAFVRGADAATRNVYVMDSDGNNVRQLTFHQRQKFGLAWTVDGKYIVFSCDEGGTSALWRVAAEGGKPERLPFGTDNASDPAISPSGDRLAYAQGASTWSVLRWDLKNPGANPVTVFSSLTQDSAPKLSPDGNFIAYQSTRSGAQEIWVSEKDGGRPIRLTSFDGPLTGSPSWSPNGQQIAFDSRVDDHAHIYVMSADGRSRRALTTGQFNDIIPSWSRDAQWIYFGSKRDQRWQIWKVSVSTGEVLQVTNNGGFVAAESPDGRWLYYTKYALPGLWRQPVKGGSEEFVLPGPPINYWGGWCMSDDGIYFIDQDASGWSVRFLAHDKGIPVQVVRLSKRPPMFSSLSVSHDNRWLLVSDEAPASINIQIVSGLR